MSTLKALWMLTVIVMLSISAANPDRPPLVIGVMSDLISYAAGGFRHG